MTIILNLPLLAVVAIQTCSSPTPAASADHLSDPIGSCPISLVSHAAVESQFCRERLLGFIVGVALCCMISGCLSILAKNGRDQSMASTRMARLATPHDDTSMSSSELSNDSGNMDGLSRKDGQTRNGVKTAATLCIAAAMCCAITALGAILLLRGPREGYEYSSEEENSEVYMNSMDKNGLTEVKIPEDKRRQQNIVGDELEESTPEEAVK